MAGAKAATGIAMEMLIKQHQLFPIVLIGQATIFTIERPLTRFIRQKELHQASLDFPRNLRQVHHLPRSGWTFHLEGAANKMVIALQRLNQQIIQWKPDRATPV